MFNAYRFIERGGNYLPADPVETAAEVYDYVQTYKDQYAEIRITADHDDFIAVQAYDGIIVFPRKWALLEVKQKFIDTPDIFNSGAFKQALERSGFEVDSEGIFTAQTAQLYLTGLYESIVGED